MKTHAITSVLVAFMAAAPASAEQVLANQPQIVSLLQAKGYKAELIQGKETEYIRTADSGVPITILFMNCAKGKRSCTTIQFYTGFSEIDTTHQRINDWNMNHRWGRAYIDRTGDPVIEMDVDMDFGGISSDLFYDNLNTFVATIPQFKAHLTK